MARYTFKYRFYPDNNVATILSKLTYVAWGIGFLDFLLILVILIAGGGDFLFYLITGLILVAVILYFILSQRYLTNYEIKLKTQTQKQEANRYVSDLISVKKKFPNFNLATEMQNEEFAMDVSLGYSYIDAYEKAHGIKK